MDEVCIGTARTACSFSKAGRISSGLPRYLMEPSPWKRMQALR